MSDDSSNDSQGKRLQRVSTTRHWRQRYVGLDGDYIYRKAMNIRGPDGKLRRVGRGEPVDIENDGLVARRLKALWYAEAIELADPTQQYRPRKVTVRDNLATRREEEALQAAEDRQLKEARRLRRELNAKNREEAHQRASAEKAVRAAEEAERLAELDHAREAQRAKDAETAQALLAKRTEQAAEEAELEREIAAEQAQLETERAEIAAERAEQAEREAGEERAKRDQESARRAEEREQERLASVRSEEERDALQAAQQPSPNPSNQSVDAREQQEEVLGKRASDKE